MVPSLSWAVPACWLLTIAFPAFAAAPPLAPAGGPDDSFRIAPGQTERYADLLLRGEILGRTGRVLVGLTDEGAPPVERGAVAAPLWSAGLVTTVLPGGLIRVTPAPGTDDLALARRLDALPGVEFAVPDLLLPLRTFETPSDLLYPDQWHLENTGQSGVVDTDIDAALAWQFATGAGQIIAIIDTGTQPDHPDLRVTLGYDYVDHDTDSTPDYADPYGGPHGTGTAGIAAATGNNGVGVAGVAFDAEIYAIRLIGGSTSSEDLYNAFVEAVDSGAGVLSNSWGYGSCDPVSASTVFTKMFRYAENHGRGELGSVVVFAAGNDGCDIADNGMLNMEYPVTVAAMESTDVRSYYSDFGDAVDIAAPTSILTTDWTSGGYGSYNGDDGYYGYFAGTSGATPVVAGVFALMFEANPRLTAADAREILCQTGVKVDLANVTYDAEGRNPYYGCGRVNAGAAVAAVANGAPETPTVPADETVPPGPANLTWVEAVDPDGDALSYVVRWSVAGPTPNAADGWPDVAVDSGSDRADSGSSGDSAASRDSESGADTGADSGGSADSGADSGADPTPVAQTSGESTVTGLYFRPPVSLVEGNVLAWTVASLDAWGEGAQSAAVTLTVVAPEVPPDAPPETDDDASDGKPGGCSSSGAPESLVLALTGLLALYAGRRPE